MNFKDKVRQLNNILEDNILPLIDSDYVYLDFPMYFNIGDVLIAQGSFELLNKSTYKCRYKSSVTCIDYSRINENHIIILQGGGNFGDLYRGANEFRNEVILKFPNNKIIIFPQSIHYASSSYVEQDAQIFSKHRNLYILGRDEFSYNFIKKNFSENNALLVPDTAFCLVDYIDKYLKTKTKKKIKPDTALYFLRDDFEIGVTINFKNQNFDISDWSEILNTKGFKIRLWGFKIISKIRRVSLIMLNINMFNALQNWYSLQIIYPYSIKLAINYFMNYNKIYTTRLHGVILSTLLGIPFVCLDNSYRKNSRFVDAYLSDLDNIEVRKHE